MKIVVNEKNRQKIDDAIKAAEGRASARTITAQIVFKAVQLIEKKLNIPKKYMAGVVAQVDWYATEFPSAYKYTPQSTHVTLVKVASGWAVTEIKRDITRRGNDRFRLVLTDDARTALIAKYERFYI